MAYCDRCGAYIPDGQTVCLACGYDPALEERRSQNGHTPFTGAQGTAWDAQQAEDLRRQAREQERAKKQEEYRRKAQEEYDRRRRQEARERQTRQQTEPYAGHPYSAQGQANREWKQDISGWGQSGAHTKLFSILSYISILFVLPFIFCPNDRLARFHAKQGLILFLFGIVADIFTGIFGLGVLLSIFRLVCMIKGIINAANGREEPLPYIGRLGL